MTESRLYGATIAFECSKMKAKILELSKMALFQVDTFLNIKKFVSRRTWILDREGIHATEVLVVSILLKQLHDRLV